MSGEAESAAPSGFEAAFVFEHRDGCFAGVATAVALFPGGGAEGDVLVGVEQVGWDTDLAVAALFVFDGQVWSGFGWDGVGVAGFGVGGDPSGALGAGVLSAAVVEFAVSCPPPQGTVDIPLGHFFGLGVLGWDVHVFGQSRR